MPVSKLSQTSEGLEQILIARAREYRRELPDGQVSLEAGAVSGGPLSTIYPFTLRVADARLDLIVKMPPSSQQRAKGGARADSCRPRLAPVLDQRCKFRWEAATLRAIEERLKQFGEERFSPLEVLDFVEHHNAIVLERRSEPSLKFLLRRNARDRLLSARRNLTAAFRNTGSWLRVFHDLSDLEHTVTRLETRDAFTASVALFCEYLGARTERPKFFEELSSRIETLADRWLDRELPLGFGHGDLAPRNVLVNAQDGVTVLDTRGAYRVPIFEDLAYFLVAIKTNRLQSYSLGWAFPAELLRGYRNSFLNGYFGSRPVPHESLLLFELQALLDKWSSATETLDRGRGRSGGATRYTYFASSTLLKRSVSRILQELESK